MAYSISSPSAQDDAELDQFRINRLGGAQMDYELARIAAEHPDLTPDQVRMVQQGGLGVSPSTRLLTGAGLPARYRITGADPQEQPPYSAINPRPIGRNSLSDSIARQENQFRLNQIQRAQSQLDKLDPTDDDNSDKISELKGRIEDFKSQASESPAVAPTPATIPLGEGTAGEEAPVYQAGGPAAVRRLSNGGSIYFGPAAGAPPFRVGAAPQPAPNAAQPVAAPPDSGNAFMGAVDPATLGGVPTPAFQLGNIPALDGSAPAPAFRISPTQIKKRVAIAKQLTALGPDAPQEYVDAVNSKLADFDSSVTNPAAKSFRISAPQTATDAAFGALPDSETPAIPIVGSQDEYDALPAGAQYRDSNGALATKKGNQ